MKKISFLFTGMVLMALFGLVSLTTVEAKADKCVTIQDGVLMYSAGHFLEGEPLVNGFDAYGYNYQGHMFKGSYVNTYLGKDGFPPYEGDDEAYLADNPIVENRWYWPYRTTQLLMKWDDAWLSNKDCDDDGKLDRHYGYPSYIGSGAWLTNHMWDSYEDEGETYEWNYFTKIVAAPADAYQDSGVWYTGDGEEIGPVLWSEFATVLEVYNDQGTGEHGVVYKSPVGPGFGKF